MANKNIQLKTPNKEDKLYPITKIDNVEGASQVSKTGSYNDLLNIPNSIPYTTTAPTEANPNGLRICVLSSEPSTKYDGWLYFITN